MGARPVAAAFVAALSPFVGLATAAPACDVSGTWSESFGTTFLRMSPGGSVSGNYTWENGTLAGIMDGVFLNGTWAEEPTFAGPRDAGTFSWEFAPDCSSFGGSYAYAESPEASAGSWSGTRAGGPAPGPDPLPWELRAPACDPTGDWETNLDDVAFYVRDWTTRPVAMHGRYYTAGRAQVGELTGNLSGVEYEGRWFDPEVRRTGAFALRFDADCMTFSGRWTEPEAAGEPPQTWTGRRATPQAPPEPEPATPTPTTVEESIATPTEGEHLPGVGEDPDDPAGIPSPSAALVLAALAGSALLLARRAGRR